MADTLQQRLCRGLESLGYRRIDNTRTKRYVVYKSPDDKLWYAGVKGALRLGTTIDNSAAVPKLMRDYVLHAATARPAIAKLLTADLPAQGVDLDELTARTVKADAKLNGIPERIVMLHVRQWLRDSRIEYQIDRNRR
jgi:hypothetical protein